MINAGEARIQVRGFSQAFEQMCNFIAIAKTGNPRETIRGLVILCLLEFPRDNFVDPVHFCNSIETLFGVVIPSGQIVEALHDLEKSEMISPQGNNTYRLNPTLIEPLRQKIEESKNLEGRVKSVWFEQLKITSPSLPEEAAWKTLRSYLARTFRRHGIQAAALLDPTIDTPPEHDVSLSSILRDAIRENLSREHHTEGERAVSDFLARVGTDMDRTRYVAQLADGAFNFYTLEVPAELADSLRANLNELTLFLDTNFLFGILDLHYNSQVDVSHDLLRAILKHKMPFKLRYHEATGKEMSNTIDHYGTLLRSRVWTSTLSRAASQTRNLSGIEQKFHERNAVRSIDAVEFLRPYEHFDQLLAEKNIKIFRPSKNEEQARIDLYHEYQEFLTSHRRGDKSYETVMHDATVLEEARRLRSGSASTLEAGALIITCDYYLYRFDWESSRRNGHRACVLLPNIFWQILRPFVPVDQDFEKAFAETFALPEFRALGSGGGKACSKMLQILATYKDVPEQTAFKLLSNDLLLDRLKTTSDDKQFAAQVEVAFVDENRNLLEEKASLESQLKETRRQHETEAKSREQDREKYNREEARLKEALSTVQRELVSIRGAVDEHRGVAEEAARKAQEAEQSARAVRERAGQTEKQIVDAQHHAFRMSVAAGFSVGLVAILVFELIVYGLPWGWLRDHPNTLPLQIGACMGFLLLSLAAFVSHWRAKLLGSSGLVALAFVLLALLGKG